MKVTVRVDGRSRPLRDACLERHGTPVDLLGLLDQTLVVELRVGGVLGAGQVDQEESSILSGAELCVLKAHGTDGVGAADIMRGEKMSTK